MEPGDKQGHWWNGRWGRLARVDVVLYSDGGQWTVEHRTGGVEGRSTWTVCDSEKSALDRVAQLLADTDGWREL